MGSRMIILLAPSKTMDFDTPVPSSFVSQKPLFEREARVLVNASLGLGDSFDNVFSISDKLGAKTRLELEEWGSGAKKPALWAYIGDVYAGLGISSVLEASYGYVHDTIRVISGLYGYVRPGDLIERYRLEMKTRLSGEWGSSLYDFWGSKIADEIVKDIGPSGTIINATSQEYMRSIKKFLPPGITVITPKFLQEYEDGTRKDVTVYTKISRGLLARYLAMHRIRTPDALTGFDLQGYSHELEDDDFDLVYTRDFTPFTLDQD
ncbi:MAG: YaaA family protein [Patescibacteria group bacterium]